MLAEINQPTSHGDWTTWYLRTRELWISQRQTRALSNRCLGGSQKVPTLLIEWVTSPRLSPHLLSQTNEPSLHPTIYFPEQKHIQWVTNTLMFFLIHTINISFIQLTFIEQDFYCFLYVHEETTSQRCFFLRLPHSAENLSEEILWSAGSSSSLHSILWSNSPFHSRAHGTCSQMWDGCFWKILLGSSHHGWEFIISS